MRQRGNNTSGTPGVTLMTVRRKRADGHVAEEQHWVARLERKGQGGRSSGFRWPGTGMSGPMNWRAGPSGHGGHGHGPAAVPTPEQLSQPQTLG
jgi:hypothetical protein